MLKSNNIFLIRFLAGTCIKLTVYRIVRCSIDNQIGNELNLSEKGASVPFQNDTLEIRIQQTTMFTAHFLFDRTYQMG
jgi:hypothetical protein